MSENVIFPRGYIKPFQFWEPTTWVIPKLYWDAYSQEQRIHAICRQLGKVIQYCDYLGLNTDDIAGRLQDIEDGKLDQFIIDCIEEWFTENEPEIMERLDTLDEILPVGDFSAETTVADVLRMLFTMIGEGFGEENTIADNIDNLGNAVGTIVDEIGEGFNNENTIADNIERIDKEIGAGFGENNTIASNINTIHTEIGEGFDEDNTIADNIETLQDYRLTHNEGIYLSPAYVGDFIVHLQFGSCCRVGDFIYAFCACDGNDDSTAAVKVFDIAQNVMDRQNIGITLGHANSCAYDSERESFWIAPLNTYSSGTITSINKLYKYNSALSSKVDVDLPNKPFGVSFDHVTKNLYTICTTGDDYLEIYRMTKDENAFSLYKKVDRTELDKTGRSTTFQDFAVYDNVGYLVRPEGTMVSFMLDKPNPENDVSFVEVNATYRIGYIDAGFAWRFGEIEGIEFCSTGELYNARNCTFGISDHGFNYPFNNAFVTEISFNNNTIPLINYEQTIHNTLALNASTIAKFALGQSEIRSLNQTNNTLRQFSTVNVTGEVYEANVVRLINHPFTFNIADEGNYGCRNMVCHLSMLAINVGNDARLRFRSSNADDKYAIDSAKTGCTYFIKNDGSIEMESQMNSFIHYTDIQPLIIMNLAAGTPSSLPINASSRSSGAYYGVNSLT